MTGEFRWKQADQRSQLTLFGVDGDDVLEQRRGVGEFRDLEFLHVRAKKIINAVPASSRMPFRYTLNAYRGCSHACVYCFARPTHEYLNLDIGRDFDTKIVVKVNAVERLRAELRKPAWRGDAIAMGTNTDPYQRCEGKYRLTRGIVETLTEARNPFSILTKSSLVVRDIDVLSAAASCTHVQVNFSIPTVDEHVWRKTEPGTPHPMQRVNALRRLVDAGVECGVLMAPVLPGLTDDRSQLAAVVQRCVDAGASWVAASPLHLRAGVKQHWMQWLATEYPELVTSYESMYHRSAYLPGRVRDHVAERVKTLHERSSQQAANGTPSDS